MTPSMTYHIDRCLSCFSCMTACPSGVDYMHLVDLARVRIEAKGTAPRTSARCAGSCARCCPIRGASAWRCPWAGWRGRSAADCQGGLRAVRRRARAGAAQAGQDGEAHQAEIGDRQGPKAKRVALMLGCVQETLAPSISLSAIRLLRATASTW